jgi:hypothetical protein
VLLTPDLTRAQYEPLRAALHQLGFTPTLRVVPQTRTDLPTWVVLISLPLTAFLTTLGAKLAEDSYRGLRSAIRNLLSRSREATSPAQRTMPTLILQDQHTDIQIVLDAELPDHGYQLLTVLDLRPFGTAPIRYDHASGRWHAPADDSQG